MRKIYVYWNELQEEYVRELAYSDGNGHFTKDIFEAHLFDEEEVKTYDNLNNFKQLTEAELNDLFERTEAWQEDLEFSISSLENEIMEKQDELSIMDDRLDILKGKVIN